MNESADLTGSGRAGEAHDESVRGTPVSRDDGRSSSADAMYRDDIMHHCKHPCNFREVAGAWCYHDHNPHCGDEIAVYIRVRSETAADSGTRPTRAAVDEIGNAIIEDISFKGRGCCISMAAASKLSEAMKGRPLSALMGLTPEGMLGILGIPVVPMRLKCATLALQAYKKAVMKAQLEYLEAIEANAAAGDSGQKSPASTLIASSGGNNHA